MESHERDALATPPSTDGAGGLAVLERVSTLAVEARDLDALLAGLVRELVSSVPGVTTAAVLLDDGGILRTRAASGLEPVMGEPFGLAVGEGFEGIIAATRRPLALTDPASSPMAESPALRMAGLRAVYGVPLVVGGEVVGVAHVGSTCRAAFTPEGQALVRAISARVSSAIALHVVRSDAARRARQQSMVADLGRFALGGASRRVLLARAARVVEEGLGARYVSVIELQPGRRFVARSFTGWTSEDLADVGTLASPSLQAHVVREGRPEVVSDLSLDARFTPPASPWPAGLRSAVAVPIPLGPGRTFGAITAYGSLRAAFGTSQVDFVVAVANILGESLLRFEEQDRLRASEESLRLAADAASLGTWEWSPETGAVTWSDRTYELFGEARGAPLTYERYLALLPEEDRHRLEAVVAAALRPDGPGRFETEHRVRPSDGSTRWIAGHGQVIFDELRRPVRVLGTVADITARKRTAVAQAFLARASAELATSLDVHERLARVARLPVPDFADLSVVELLVSETESERVASATADPALAELAQRLQRRHRLRASLGAGVAAVIATGEPLLVRDVDDAFLRAAARDAAELDALCAARSICCAPLVARGRVFGALTLVSQRRSYDDEDLALVHALATRSALAIDNARLFADQVVAREVAEAARAALAASEERRRLALDAAQLGTWEIEADTGAMDADARGRALFAAPAEGPIDVERIVAAMAPEDRPRVREAMRGFARSGGPGALELRVTGPGSPRWIACSGRLELPSHGSPKRWVGIVQDVTERKLAEQQAQAASRAKDEFLAMLGHELRNPLAPIATAVQLMKMRGSKLDERERSIIERQVRHLARLVDDLLDVSRITAGRVKLQVERVELSSVVAQAIETASPLVEQRRHRLVVSVPGRGLEVQGDATRLAQVVANLLTNSAKYTSPGGHIRVEAERAGDLISLRVVDDGIGIDPELLPRVFELFAQGAQALDRSQGGLGLGLAIARSLVRMHGGTIEASSAGEGRGTEMLVRLPAASEATETSPLPSRGAPETAHDRGRGRILVVDDNVDAAELLAEALSAEGYLVRAAFDPSSALEMAASFEPELAVLDVGLPVMDGFELGLRLRQRPGLAGLPLVAVTGYGQPEDRERSRRAGFDAHLVKPIDLELLGRTARELLASSGQRRER